MVAEHSCLSCGHTLSEPVLDLGELPPCNRYVKAGVVASTADAARKVTYGQLTEGRKIERHLETKPAVKTPKEFCRC